MNITDYDYHLPPELIAQHPPAKRGGSRMLVVGKTDASLYDKQFTDITALLDDRYFLILNDTSVLPARLKAVKITGVKKEILYLKSMDPYTFTALIKGRTRTGEMLRLHEHTLTPLRQNEDGSWTLSSGQSPVASILEQYGHMPLPPYIRREAGDEDLSRYQTVYAAHSGSIAAPTAGLHFTEEVLARLKQKKIPLVYITLHVGTGTFRPIRTDRVEEHRMHSEPYFISSESADTINQLIQSGKIPVCVGTTAVRAVESAAEGGLVKAGEGSTTLFITPGYRFQITKAMLTNFHLPRSTLLVLVSALTGMDMLRRAYAHAVRAGYRFYSYGDAMLILE